MHLHEQISVCWAPVGPQDSGSKNPKLNKTLAIAELLLAWLISLAVVCLRQACLQCKHV